MAIASTPSADRRPSPRFELNWINAQWGLAVAVKLSRYATFRCELLLVIGPLVFVFGLWKNQRRRERARR